MGSLASILLAIICTEALTQLVVHSEILRPIREFIEDFGDYAETLVNCGYCMSVWIAMPCAYLMAPLIFPTHHWMINFVIWTLVVHRCSNFLDDFVDKYLSNESGDDDFELVDDFSEANDHFGVIHRAKPASHVEVEVNED